MGLPGFPGFFHAPSALAPSPSSVDRDDLTGELTRRRAICEGALDAGSAIIRTVLVLLP
jgi:hypothetical protein